ncbi:hypothetical protein FB45DRAFT_1082235 [Roridomyces roridus]|uniref:FATC domain-containing protein n=1 Tax=Roridomyces roridus TaxID=1738132 RepID=A0AAD7FLM4_9AGAR|nr:hypothetical protein FB45DRAFT_1082235 [Roridomyces roridus]
MSSIPDIPQELVAKIVGELRDDLPSLRASGLISRSFLPWSRLHLFFSVRLTPRNVYAFRTLVAPSPDVAMYMRRLDIPSINNDLPSSALLPPESLAQLPNITHLSAHADPFGFRQLSESQRGLLTRGLQHVTTVYIRILNHFWALPEWARVLNGCSNLTELDIHAESTGWAMWNADELQMPVAEAQNRPRLHTLRRGCDEPRQVPGEGAVPIDEDAHPCDGGAPLRANENDILNAGEETAGGQEVRDKQALLVSNQVQHKLTGRDFNEEIATSLENLCQNFAGWCAFW